MKSPLHSLPLILCLLGPTSWANNIAVQNVAFTSQNLSAQSVVITMDLTWENSWRVDGGPGNWDAAWVFAKFRSGGGGSLGEQGGRLF